MMRIRRLRRWASLCATRGEYGFLFKLLPKDVLTRWHPDAYKMSLSNTCLDIQADPGEQALNLHRWSAPKLSVGAAIGSYEAG